MKTVFLMCLKCFWLRKTYLILLHKLKSKVKSSHLLSIAQVNIFYTDKKILRKSKNNYNVIHTILSENNIKII